MKRILLAGLLALLPSAAWAQCTGIFPNNTLCGNISGSPKPPGQVPIPGTVVIGPGSSTNNGLVLWNGTTGTTLKDGAGGTIAGNYTWSGTQLWNGAVTFGSSGTHNGTEIFTGTAAPALSAGQTLIGGTLGGTPSFVNGSSAFYNTAVLGTVINGRGSGNDITINGTAGSVCGIATGGTTWACSNIISTNPIVVSSGGTGNATATNRSIPINQGTSPQANTGTGTAGQVLYSGGAAANPSWQTSPTTFAAPANPTGTTSAGGVMMGLGSSCTITPTITGRVRIMFQGSVASTSVATNNLQLRTGTGAAPANGAALTGTQRSTTISATNSTASGAIPFNIYVLATGLTLSTALWFDLSLGTNAGTASVTSINCGAEEF